MAVQVYIFSNKDRYTIVGSVAIFTRPSTGLYTTGGVVYIQCEYSNELVFDSFVHPIFGQLQRTMGNYHITDENNVASLDFRAITEEDAGTYFCTFNARSGNGRDHQLTMLNFLPSVAFEGQVRR